MISFFVIFFAKYHKLIVYRTSLGCSNLTNADEVNNNIALALRGGCTFSEIVSNAEAAGARVCSISCILLVISAVEQYGNGFIMHVCLL
jgi:hypothetical protein